jgi:hypothetical protein
MIARWRAAREHEHRSGDRTPRSADVDADEQVLRGAARHQ